MNKWIAEFELEDGDSMPEHMDLNYIGAKIDFHCRPMWIPVSERLPKKGEIVLWCNKDGSVFSSAITYLTKTSFSVGKHYDVIAWMPLPEPYKAESEDKE